MKIKNRGGHGRISQIHAEYLPVEVGQRSRGKKAGSNHYPHLSQSKGHQACIAASSQSCSEIALPQDAPGSFCPFAYCQSRTKHIYSPLFLEKLRNCNDRDPTRVRLRTGYCLYRERIVPLLASTSQSAADGAREYRSYRPASAVCSFFISSMWLKAVEEGEEEREDV